MLPSSSLEAVAKYHTHYGGNRDINYEAVEAVLRAVLTLMSAAVFALTASHL